MDVTSTKHGLEHQRKVCNLCNICPCFIGLSVEKEMEESMLRHELRDHIHEQHDTIMAR